MLFERRLAETNTGEKGGDTADQEFRIAGGIIAERAVEVLEGAGAVGGDTRGVVKDDVLDAFAGREFDAAVEELAGDKSVEVMGAIRARLARKALGNGETIKRDLAGAESVEIVLRELERLGHAGAELGTVGGLREDVEQGRLRVADKGGRVGATRLDAAHLELAVAHHAKIAIGDGQERVLARGEKGDPGPSGKDGRDGERGEKGEPGLSVVGPQQEMQEVQLQL
jgi:hypothetical protein